MSKQTRIREFRPRHLGRAARHTALGLLLLALGSFVAGVPAARAQSDHVTLLAHYDEYPYTSGCWGYSAPDGTELAIFGVMQGTVFLDVTDVNNVHEAALIEGPPSGWREIRTAGHYAYISNETGDGLQIVDLANPALPRHVAFYDQDFTTCHSLHFDEQTGYLYCNGTRGNGADTGFVVLSLVDPEHPEKAGGFSDYYVHDMYSRGGVGYLSAIYAGSLGIVDLSALPEVTPISSTGYAGAATHNCWLNEDGRYLLTTDETAGGHLRVWDVQNLTDPREVASWEVPGDRNSIVHNVYVRGSYAYLSHYTAGLQILDISDPTHPVRVGYYDTYPGSGGYNGAWGCYPFAASGHVYISDIQSGLYVFGFDALDGRIEGRITDSASGQGLGGVDVRDRSANARTTTAADGSYALRVREGEHRLRFELLGYQPDSLLVSVQRAAVSSGDLALQSLPVGSARGLALLTPEGSPLAGVAITFEQADPGRTELSAALRAERVVAETLTDANGRFAVPRLYTGDYKVFARRFGFVGDSASVPIQEEVETAIDFSLHPDLAADDLEADLGWTVGAPDDNAESGIWVRVDPHGTRSGTAQPEDDHGPGVDSLCFVTGDSPDRSDAGLADVDGGKTTLYSPVFDLTRAVDPQLRYYRWFANDARTDEFLVEATSDAGATWITLERLRDPAAIWTEVNLRLSDYLATTESVQFRFIASDEGAPSLVEAAVDDLELWSTDPLVPLPGALSIRAAGRQPILRGDLLELEVPAEGHVSVKVYDPNGRAVRQLFSGTETAGLHELAWDGRDDRGQALATGVYFLRVEAGAKSYVTRVVYLD